MLRFLNPKLRLLWDLLTHLILPPKAESAFRFLDAGAGTARWTTKILDHYPQAHAHLVDISTDMLQVAKDKLEQREYLSRVDIQIGDVRQISHLRKASLDVILCLHNVMGFFEDSLTALRCFYDLLKPGGKCAVMFPSFYHAVYFCNATGRLGQLEPIQQGRHVQYNDAMPPLKVFEIPEIDQLGKEAGFAVRDCYGFPLTVYPGMAETFLHGSTDKLIPLFDETYRNQLKTIELQLCRQSALAARGNNILAIFTKS